MLKWCLALEIETVGVNHTMLSEELNGVWGGCGGAHDTYFWVVNRKDERPQRGAPSYLFKTYIDSISKTIQLLSNLLYSYWPSISEHPTFPETSTICMHSAFYLSLR